MSSFPYTTSSSMIYSMLMVSAVGFAHGKVDPVEAGKKGGKAS